MDNWISLFFTLVVVTIAVAFFASGALAGLAKFLGLLFGILLAASLVENLLDEEHAPPSV